MKRSIRDIVRRERWARAFDEAVARCPRDQEDDGNTVAFAPLICLHRGYNGIIRMDDDEPVAPLDVTRTT